MSISGAATVARIPASATARAAAGAMPVHVPEAHGPGPDHLEAREPRPPVDVLGFELPLDRPDLLLEPAHQRQVVAVAAEQRHRGVGVAVDQRRREDRAGGVEYVVARLGLHPGSDFDDHPCPGSAARPARHRAKRPSRPGSRRGPSDRVSRGSRARAPGGRSRSGSSGASWPRGAISDTPTFQLTGSAATGIPVMSHSAVSSISGSPAPPACPRS